MRRALGSFAFCMLVLLVTGLARRGMYYVYGKFSSRTTREIEV